MRFFSIFGFLFLAVMVQADPLPADRRIDWTHVGNGGVIPTNYTFFCNVRTNIPGTNIVATGNGSTDDTPALQAAINLATNNSIVYLPAGTYGCVDLSIKGKHIILRGDGTNSVISNWGGANDGIKIYASSYSANWSGSNNITAGATNGSVWFRFNNNSPWGNGNPSLMVGAWYGVGSQTDPPDVIRDGCNDGAGYLHNYRQIVQITNIVNGTNIYFTPPLRWDLSSCHPYVSIISTWGDANFCGIENLKITFTQAGTPIRSLIHVSGVQNCWVTGCELAKTVNNAIELEFTSGDIIRSNVIHHAWDYVGGWGYGIWPFDCANDCLIENNIFYNMRHGFATEGFVTGCVFAYNYMTNECFRSTTGTPANSMSGDIITHAVGAKYNLIEGNVTDRIMMDNVHASGLRNTMFRNRVLPVTHNDDFPDGSITYGRIAITVQLHNNYESVIGNVLGIAGLTVNYENSPTNWNSGYADWIYMNGYSCDYVGSAGTAVDCQSNLLRAVNWDTASGTTKTDAGLDTSLPNSYYLTGKPAWWGSGAWPAIGPDLTPMFTPIPAQGRFAGGMSAKVITPPSLLHPITNGP